MVRLKNTDEKNAQQKDLIIRALEAEGGNVRKARMLLGLSHSTFYFRCEKHEISITEYRIKRAGRQST